MNAKFYYDEVNEKFLAIERDLLSFLKEAEGEDIDGVIDTFKFTYDPSNDDSVLAAAYAIEFGLLKYSPLPEEEARRMFIEENSHLIYEIVSIEEYRDHVNNGAPANENVERILEQFSKTRRDYRQKFKTKYIPSSTKLSNLVNQISDLKQALVDANREYHAPIRKYKESPDDIIIHFFMAILCFVYSGVGTWFLRNELLRYGVDEIFVFMLITVILTALYGLLYIYVPLRFAYAKQTDDMDWMLQSAFARRWILLIVDFFTAILALVIYHS